MGETGRSLHVQIQEHKRNLREGLTDKRKLPQHMKKAIGEAGENWKHCKLKLAADVET